VLAGFRPVRTSTARLHLTGAWQQIDLGSGQVVGHSWRHFAVE
jgi:hypothetical protein